MGTNRFSLKLRWIGIFLIMPVLGQEGPVTFEFSFSNPGARAMALGGAFAALADDATTAFANPAGLVQLIEPEVSLEGRNWSHSTPYVEGGRASGEATGVGIDTVNGLRYGTSVTDLDGVSFLSFVLPMERWSFAAYRHMWANFELTSEVNGLFGEVDQELERSEDVLARTDFQVINNGLAAAFELTENLSAGFGMVYFEGEIDSLSEEFAQEEDAFFEPNPYRPELLDTTYSFRGKDSGVVGHVGFLWRPSSQWSLGGYYRSGPRMKIHLTETSGPADEPEDPDADEVDIIFPFHLPTVYGLGIAYRSKGGALTTSVEWDRVGYSSMGVDMDKHVFDPGQHRIVDGDELHLGLEYVWVTRKVVVAVRLGSWRDPAHGLDSGPEADLFESTIFDGGDDQTHYTGGLGFVFKNIQLDLGFDFSESVDHSSLSMVYRFP